MDIRRSIRPFDRVQIEKGGKLYMAAVDELIDESCFTITQPWQKQRRLGLVVGETVLLQCVNERGIIVMMATVEGESGNDNVHVYHMSIKGDPQRIQRREGYRANVGLDVMVRKIVNTQRQKITPGEKLAEKVKCADISESGMQILLSIQANVGDVLECVISLDKYGFNDTLPKIDAEVVRKIKGEFEGDRDRIGVRFIDIPDKVKYKLIKFITFSQRKDKT